VRTWAALVIASPDDLVAAALIDHDVAAIEETADAWRVFFHSPGARDAAAAVLKQDFPAIRLEPLEVPDDNWAARSQAGLKAITVGALTVAPPWDAGSNPKAQSPNPKAQTIVINPSMGFGTGHHATTRLCLAALQKIDLRRQSVIDVGTGSGVLAIAASLLGAASAIGIDDDLDAIQAATENAELNPRAKVTFETVDVRGDAREPADLVLANLTGGLIVAAAGQLQALTRPGGRLILSGFMTQEEEDVLRAFDYHEVMARAQEDEWVCVTLRRPAVF
jgi:ribosomal protein L11 methyltransferase